jgi:D-xylose transport system ATP-binding protein
LEKPILIMQDIIKDFPGVRALKNVSFDVCEGEIHALVGENGAGKSTLMKILSGVYPHYSFSGKLMLKGEEVKFNSTKDSEKEGIAIIHQELLLANNLSAAENIFLGDEISRFGFVNYNLMVSRAQKLIDSLQIDIDVRKEIAELGVGKQQLVEIAKALKKESSILVLDEPTSALTENETKYLLKLLKELSAKGKSIIYISHKLEEIFEIADRITVLRDGKTVKTANTSEWNRSSLINAMVGRELSDMFPKVKTETGEVLMEVENLTVKHPEIESKNLLTDISFKLRRGETLGIAGLIGSGRTELLSTIFGAPPGLKTMGKVKLMGKEINFQNPQQTISGGLALVSEDRKNFGLVLELSVKENISVVHLNDFCKLGFVNENEEILKCNEIFKQLDIRASSIKVTVETLSGGNQQKIVLGKWLIKQPKVLLLDEPTRGIDVGAKVEIYNLINKLKLNGIGIIVVSSELPEIIGISDRVLVMKEGEISAELTGENITQEKIMENAA